MLVSQTVHGKPAAPKLNYGGNLQLPRGSFKHNKVFKKTFNQSEKPCSNIAFYWTGKLTGGAKGVPFFKLANEAQRNSECFGRLSLRNIKMLSPKNV